MIERCWAFDFHSDARVAPVEAVGQHVLESQDQGHQYDQKREQLHADAAAMYDARDLFLIARQTISLLAEQGIEILDGNAVEPRYCLGDIGAETAADAPFGPAGLQLVMTWRL